MDSEKRALNDIRNMLGFLGMILPVALLVFNLLFGKTYNPDGVLNSISATYYSSSFVFMVGLVFGTGLFLIRYRGYDMKDRVASIISGCGALTLTLFPCMLPDAQNRNFMMLPMVLTNILHLAGAFAFFAALIFIIFFQFTKSGEKAGVGTRKWMRNILYRVCAIIMACSLITGFTMARFSDWSYWVFAGEALALWAFGIAWLTKGGKILKDL